MAPRGIDEKADTERPHDVEYITGLQIGHAMGAGADTFVQKFNAARLPVHLIDTHGTAQERTATFGRRAQQMKELSGLHPERPLGGLENKVLIAVIDPIVGHHRANMFPDLESFMGARFYLPGL